MEARRAWLQAKRGQEGLSRVEGSDAPVLEPEPPPHVARVEIESAEVDAQTVLREKLNRWGNRLTVLENRQELKVDGRYLSRALPSYDVNGRPAVSFTLNAEGATCFANLTGPNRGRYLAALLDDRIREQAVIQSRICDRGQITGTFSIKEVQAIAALLQGGQPACPAASRL